MFVALLLAAAQPPPGEPQQLEFLAGRAGRGRWRMEVATLVEIESLPPRIAGHRCTIAGPGVRLAYSTSGPTIFELGGAGHDYRNADIIGFEIGGVDYEARMWTEQVGDGRYRDIEYPAGFVGSRRPAPAATPSFVIRRRPEDPWLSHVTLIDDMIAVPSIIIRYGLDGREGRARLSTSGFRDALRWCEENSESDRARRLPARLHRIILR